eukprot:CAMPEP_0174844486 /NCGR_PEP_ID=MMETSP1114-20130205/11122_1 /TAXON_ID=312471 /ORGANISM="Neobodo designis, Strain CCAP 1951/1" /LENGTH=497 /DNA_ID=CAMNT_0016078723 /DNA_START=36 /DNA_END=1529 /DNA_ORIENTATION=-
MPAPKESPVPGLPLINPSTLAPEFRRFKNDALYFINNVMFTAQEEEGTDNKKPEAKSRILAVTPQAVFVCDALGSMDRAVRLEQLDGLVFERRLVKKIFSKEEQIHFLIKCPTEYDIQCALEGNSSNDAVLKSLTRVLESAIRFKKNIGDKGFTTEELPQGQRIDEVVKKEKPADYLSPKDIIAQNQARQRMIEAMDAVNRDILALQEKVTTVGRSRDDKKAELQRLQEAVGGDIKEHMKRKEEKQAEHQRLHRKHMDAEVELMRTQTELKNEQARLQEERENADILIKQSLSEASNDQDKQLEEANAVRKRAQQREVDKALKHLAALKARVSAPPSYTGPDNLVKRANDTEKQVQQAADKWEKEMEMANRLEGYFDAAISDLRLHNEQIALLVDRKKELLAERSRRQNPAPAASPAKAPIDDDDDLLGGGPSPAKPAAAKAAPIDDDDDLLGGGPTPAKPAAAKPAPIDDDDDLLGGPAPTASKPAPAAAAADDLL